MTIDKAAFCIIIYREYDRNSFIYDPRSVDFTIFTNKLTMEQLRHINEYSERGGSLFLDKPYLKFACNREKAISIVYATLSIISTKENLPYNHSEVFNFMVDNLIDKIFE